MGESQGNRWLGRSSSPSTPQKPEPSVGQPGKDVATGDAVDRQLWVAWLCRIPGCKGFCMAKASGLTLPVGTGAAGTIARACDCRVGAG